MNGEAASGRGDAAAHAAALLVGGALGAAATGGAALLLYTERGFLATAGFLIALLFAATAAGVWVGDTRTERARAAWTAAILAFGVAAAFAALWGGRPALRAAPFGGAGAVLLILAAPAYTAGVLLERCGGRSATAAAAALLGVAAGVFAATNWGIPRLDAPFLFLTAAVALVAAAPLDAGGAIQRRRGSMRDRVVIVTGVGHEGQVGFALAHAFLAAGAHVVIADVSDAVTSLAARLGEDVLGLRADLTDPAGAERMIDEAVARHGRIDALVHAAGGLGVAKRVGQTSPDEWAREFERNATTTFLACRAALPHLRVTRGSIVCFASPAAERGVAGLAAYSAAKAGVAAFARALAREEREHGVRVNVIAPGMIDTAQNRAESGDDARFVAREHIASLALFLAGSEGGAISGETIHAEHASS